jgi:hypothetical protein
MLQILREQDCASQQTMECPLFVGLVSFESNQLVTLRLSDLPVHSLCPTFNCQPSASANILPALLSTRTLTLTFIL